MNPKIIAFAQAGGLTIYVSLVALFIQNAENWFGNQQGNPAFGVMIFLLVFILSALISASIMLGYPIMLFFKGKRKTAFKILFQSIGWLAVFLITIVLITIKN